MQDCQELKGPLIDVQLKWLPHGDGLPLPFYATEGSAGLDLCAALDKPLTLQPFQRALIPTGLCLALPRGYEAQVRPRSGFALKHGVTVLNAPGTIDADYRQEVKVLLVNLGQEAFQIERGDRIAQLVVAEFTRVAWKEADYLSGEDDRGGFGSTGIKAVG